MIGLFMLLWNFWTFVLKQKLKCILPYQQKTAINLLLFLGLQNAVLKL